MLVMDGIFQDRMEILTSPSQSSNPDDIQPGDVKFVNQNGDLVIDQNDRVHVGSSIPKFTAGINLSGYWKNFDISCFFQGAFGHKIYMQVAQGPALRIRSRVHRGRRSSTTRGYPRGSSTTPPTCV